MPFKEWMMSSSLDDDFYVEDGSSEDYRVFAHETTVFEQWVSCYADFEAYKASYGHNFLFRVMKTRKGKEEMKEERPF